MAEESDNNDTAQEEYRVLARKYRPQSFDDLIGQAALVRTLKNAIDSGRVAHAFMLTGVRGVGKTTTARIIAKALNYAGADGKGEPTTGNTDDCAIAQAITQDRHPDVMEMDAASRTGIDDIREILDGVRYAPVSARYKIYIIDEVHMLSKAAFNALLKTLEEPPSHVKFIFATTEIRKVPVTILSRCQRFDLARVGLDELTQHFTSISEKEGYKIDEEAATAIARAADGSVRDGLSLLDQAMALASQGQTADTPGASNHMTAEIIGAMLGLGDRVVTLDALEHALKGQAQDALACLHQLHQMGTDPLIVAEDMMEMTHALMVTQACEGKGDIAAMTGNALPHAEAARASTLALAVGLPGLNRAWQILLKGLQEMKQAPDLQQALSIILLRLAYATNLPDPAKLVHHLQSGNNASSAVAASQSGQAAPNTPPTLMQNTGSGTSMAQNNLAPQAVAQAQPATKPNPSTIQEIVTLCEENGALILAQDVRNYAHPVTIKSGQFEFRAHTDAPAQLGAQLSKHLHEWTGTRWIVSLANQGGDPTLAQQEESAAATLREKVLNEEGTKQVLTLFPNASLHSIIPIK